MIAKKWMLFIGVAIGIVSAILTVLWLVRPPIPSNIRRQVSFVIFSPGKNSPAKADRASFHYDSNSKILTFTAKFSPAKLIVTNQATPDTFTDVPQFYDKVVEGMRPYASFDGTSGKVSLTRPPNTNNQQVAVANTQGTLMFVRADHDLSNDQWRKFFNSLTALK